MKKKYVRSLNEIWHERKRTVGSMLVLFAVVMVAIMGVRAVLNYVDFENLKKIFTPTEEQHKYSTLYNASRYFFRIYYPEDKWEVEGETHGFFMDEKTGLVAEMYPLVFADPVTPAPDSDPKATAVISTDKVRDMSLVISYYYREYTDEMLEEAEKQGNDDNDVNYENDVETPAQEATGGTSEPAGSTPVPVKTDIVLLDLAAEKVHGDYEASAGLLYDISELKTYKTDRYGYTLRWFTYTYKNASEGNPGRKTDVYIIARSSNYIVITYEGIDRVTFLETPESYTKYKADFLDVLNEFQLSVFDD
ncbi:MAG: hypothetical protein J6Y21_03410 [Clostridia bacterium]|nr:hypothetical protein [Clostridia bacterium]